MFLTMEEVKEKIEKGLSGAIVEISNPRKDGKHLKTIVIYGGFEGKPLLEQHRMVYETLKEDMKENIHALGIETKTK